MTFYKCVLLKEYGPPEGKMSIDELRVMRAKIKEDYEKSLTEFDAQRMEQVKQIVLREAFKIKRVKSVT